MIVSIAAPQDWSRVIVSFFDITDRKRLEEQVLQSQKLESLGRLAGGIAHDFNNLLMVILGYADILLSSAEGDVALTTGLNEIRTAGERGAELTAQLLAFSRKQVLQPRSFSLNALIRESYGMLQRLIGEDVQLEISLEPGLWNLRADRGQIHQVLMNLVVNGRDAMPSGGLISLTTRNVPQHPQGECVVLEVRDTGVGMDESTRAHVFEPFFTTKRRGKGAGLGMATVFGVVTQAGGQISVESELGKGSCFRLYFPRESAPVERESTPATPAAANRLRGVILVVEDQAEVRLVTCKMLRNLGLEVVDADNAETALAFARSHPVDLLFTDVIMPGMNGRELASRFLELHPRSRVVYMSGYTDRVLGENGMVDPSIVLLQKPFNPADVARVISDELERLDRQEIRS
jgi:two-component system cell cycle sensor histidine kinase/response regulator CckA